MCLAYLYDLVKKHELIENPNRKQGSRQRCRQRMFLLAYIPVVLLLSNCAYSPLVPDISSPLLENLQHSKTQQCSEFFVEIDRVVFLTSVVDAGEFRLSGFPYLRISRFLASFNNLAENDQRFFAWVARLQILDQQARKIELSNLPKAVRQQLQVKFYPIFLKDNTSKKTLFDIVKMCGDVLRNVDMVDANIRDTLIDSKAYPDEYQFLSRVVGIYPITGLFVKLGINSYHQETLDTFNLPLHQLEVKGRSQYYVMDTQANPLEKLSQQAVQKILSTSANNELAIPEPSAEEQQRLFATFAPIIKVDIQGNYDRLGAPLWDEERIAKIDTGSPVLYTLVSHVWFEQQILLQLNYVMWFPERPIDGTFDILGGHIDGLNWRVTIGPDGRPLIYDVMHNCGCYHMFLPTTRLTLREDVAGVYEEAPLVPQLAPDVFDKQVVLHVESRTHYLQRVTVMAQASGIPYILKDYDVLRSLALGGSSGLSSSTGDRKSLFDWDGLIKGTERAERWILWPMGVLKPGAMRQWGRHATAFIGRRHFDDPGLLDRYFYYAK